MTKLISPYHHHTIDETGTVINTQTLNTKATWLGKNGYLHVDIHENGVGKKHAIHRLLAQTFIPNPEQKRTVNHIDGNKLNNKLSNLEWATDSENIQHAYDNNLNHQPAKLRLSDYEVILPRFYNGESLTTIVKDFSFSLPTLSTYIEEYTKSTGTYDKFVAEKERQKLLRAKAAKHETHRVVRINKLDPTDRVTYFSLRDAARELGKSSSGPISNVLAGRTKSAYGYYWERI